MASLEPHSVDFEAVWKNEVQGELLKLFSMTEQPRTVSASSLY